MPDVGTHTWLVKSTADLKTILYKNQIFVFGSHPKFGMAPKHKLNLFICNYLSTFLALCSKNINGMFKQKLRQKM